MKGPLSNQCSTSSTQLLEASPKAISERTSYIRVRLAFHPYPHLIPAFFSIRGFGPPVSVTWPSPWTWVDHTVSGLRPHTRGFSKKIPNALFRLAFATAPCLPLNLAYDRNSPVHSTKGTPSHVKKSIRILHSAPTTCKHTVSGSISLPFRGAFHLSLTVLVHYRLLGSI